MIPLPLVPRGEHGSLGMLEAGEVIPLPWLVPGPRGITYWMLCRPHLVASAIYPLATLWQYSLETSQIRPVRISLDIAL
jgi:hypothetical protein